MREATFGNWTVRARPWRWLLAGSGGA